MSKTAKIVSIKVMIETDDGSHKERSIPFADFLVQFYEAQSASHLWSIDYTKKIKSENPSKEDFRNKYAEEYENV